MSLRSQALPVLLPVLLAGLAACGTPAKTATDAGPGPEYNALQKDFAGYETWAAFNGGDQADDGLHIVGQRMLYLNKLPPHGSKTFPLGTIIVKTTAKSQTFAMVKRGGGFNAGGAEGWEWFEIDTTVSPPLIVWRGAAPPAGNTYGNTLTTSCNGCHVTAAEPGYDYVLGDAIVLPTF